MVAENKKLGWTYEQRLDHLIDIIAERTYDGHFIDNDHVRLTKTVYIKTLSEAKEWHTKFLDEGYEGSIYRNQDGLYKGTRSWDLMKFKDFHDAEATIIDYQIGKGKRKGTLGKFIMEDEDGNVFGCPPGKGYDYEDMAKLLENIHDYIGKIATFTYFQRTQAGSYRHPLFKCLRNYE
jgi:DNA ligase-1